MKTLDVFGIKRDQVESYVERDDVDGMFLDALKTDRQIIVYGASKQGKTSLVDKHLPYKENIVVSLTPKYTLLDIYQSVLSSMNIELISETQSSVSSARESSISARFKAMIPAVIGTESSAAIKEKKGENNSVTKESIEVNLSLPNDVARIIKKTEYSDKYIILENFHYLDEEIQKEFSFDLRSFLELGIHNQRGQTRLKCKNMLCSGHYLNNLCVR